MANSSTKFQDIAIGSGHIGPVKQYHVVIDTIDTDLTIMTPAQSDYRVFVVGITLSEGTATNLTFKSGSNALPVIELAANQGKWDPVQLPAFYLATKPGEALVMKSSAAISGMILYCVESTVIE